MPATTDPNKASDQWRGCNVRAGTAVQAALARGDAAEALTAAAEDAASETRDAISPVMKRRPLSTVLRISIAMVRGPTPPDGVGLQCQDGWSESSTLVAVQSRR